LNSRKRQLEFIQRQLYITVHQDEYKYDDGFLVPDDEIEEEHHTPRKASLEDEIQFERNRAKIALDEVYMLRKRIKTFKRKLRTMLEEKKTWEQRAKRLKATLVDKDKQDAPKIKLIVK
tara:strand:- start:69 stop:425 length:357 start_codon:yes stop_codon:yes gene_type:complete